MKIVKKTLSEQIYDSLRMNLIKGKIPLGSKLINQELQAKFEVSSTPIRDAVNRLHQDGLVVEVTKTGAKVIDLDADTFKEVNELLSTLSCAAISFAMQRSDKDEIVKTLTDIVIKQKKYVDTDDYFKYDYDFHKAFFEFAKNETFKKLYKSYHPLQELLTYYAVDIGYDKNESIKQHEYIIEALSKSDIESAKKFMNEHLTNANNVHEKLLEK